MSRNPSRGPTNLFMNHSRTLREGYGHVKSVKPSPTVFYYWQFQGGASVVVYSNCLGSSAFRLSLTFCYFIYKMYDTVGHLLGKSCLLVLFYLMLFKLCVFLSHLVSRAGCGIRLYRFLIIAFSYIKQDQLIVFSSWSTMYNFITSRSEYGPTK